MKSTAFALGLAGVLGLILAAPAYAQGLGEFITEPDTISDDLMGNEPNVIPWEPDNKGPQEYEPGSLGDAGGNSGHPYSVEGSGAPGPITCGGNWVGPAQVVAFLSGGEAGNPNTSVPGNPDAPGMNVDCGTGGSPPHSP